MDNDLLLEFLSNLRVVCEPVKKGQRDSYYVYLLYPDNYNLEGFDFQFFGKGILSALLLGELDLTAVEADDYSLNFQIEARTIQANLSIVMKNDYPCVQSVEYEIVS